MTIAELLKKAEKATPPTRTRSRWAHLLPVVDTLMTNGHTLKESVAWLIEQKQVGADKSNCAYHSLNGALRRRKAKD